MRSVAGEPACAPVRSPRHSYRFTIDDIIAEGDRVVVRGRGEFRTKAGKDYNNSYCFVLRLEEGRLVELREYLDTALVERVFG